VNHISVHGFLSCRQPLMVVTVWNELNVGVAYDLCFVPWTAYCGGTKAEQVLDNDRMC